MVVGMVWHKLSNPVKVTYRTLRPGEGIRVVSKLTLFSYVITLVCLSP